MSYLYAAVFFLPLYTKGVHLYKDVILLWWLLTWWSERLFSKLASNNPRVLNLNFNVSDSQKCLNFFTVLIYDL